MDKNPALSCAIGNLKTDDLLPEETTLRQVKYLNNIVEQDHRFIKKITKPALGFQSCRSASRTLCGIEAMHMIRKGQVKRPSIGDETRSRFINKILEANQAKIASEKNATIAIERIFRITKLEIPVVIDQIDISMKICSHQK